jgi:hypothetical protein
VTAAYYRDIAKIAQKNTQKLTWLAQGWIIILYGNVCPHLGKVVTDLLSKYEWEVLPHVPYSPDMSPLDVWLIPQVKRAHAGTPLSLPGRGFCSSYLSHLRNEQKWYPTWNSKSEILGHGHRDKGGLHRRTVMRYFLK